MASTHKLEVKQGDVLQTLQDFFRSILEMEPISAVFIPQKLPMKNRVMPTLVSNPEDVKAVDPLAPIFPLNAGRLAARLTRRPIGGKILAVMRSCEIRAFIELVKLKQARTDDIILVGIDCLGAFQNRDYYRIVNDNPFETTRLFYENVLSGKDGAINGVEVAQACRACEFPVPEKADLLIGLFGMDINDHLLVQAQTETGEDFLKGINLAQAEVPARRKEVLAALMKERMAYRDAMFVNSREAFVGIDKLTAYFANCVNCYNCRVACPVCYCRECVFYTDVFDHESSQYLQWSRRKGLIKMPTDTVFYHLTRLAHMSTACVGCGQCSNACPNDIPV
ncbi:MAG: Coenzyme F420 hydrogenase/dehydrogenase, beta subunit C-terminal domain, partial [Deltaproteobacteria bacterium]